MQLHSIYKTEPLKWNSFLKGRIGWQNLRSDEYVDEGPYLVTGTHFRNGSVDWSACYHVTQERYQMAPEIWVKPYDVLITKDGSIGKLAYIDSLPGPTCLNSHLLIIRPLKKCYLPKFSYYVLLSDIFKNYIVETQTGTTFYGISQESIANFRIPLAPLDIQKKIATFLDRKTVAIDTLIAKKQRLIQLLEEKRAALINQAVTKGLNPNAPMKDSGVPWIDGIPEHWEVSRLKFVCNLETGHTPRRSKESYWVEEECTIPWVSLNDTKILAKTDYISATKYKISPRGMANSSAHLIKEGAVVFTRDATIGLAAITTQPMAVSQHIIAWVCLDTIHNFYLLHVIYSMRQELDRLTMGSTLKTIGMADVKELITPVPPLDEQIIIANYLKEQKLKIDKTLAKVNLQIKKLQEYRQSLITAAVTGKLESQLQNTEEAVPVHVAI